MTDRELLELAAKAAGYDYQPQHAAIVIAGIPAAWNPLTDDGDALRLAVKLRLWIRYRDNSSINVCWYDDHGIFAGSVTENGDDIETATRRAIVRAAAEIGRSL